MRRVALTTAVLALALPASAAAHEHKPARHHHGHHHIDRARKAAIEAAFGDPTVEGEWLVYSEVCASEALEGIPQCPPEELEALRAAEAEA